MASGGGAVRAASRSDINNKPCIPDTWHRFHDKLSTTLEHDTAFKQYNYPIRRPHAPTSETFSMSFAVLTRKLPRNMATLPETLPETCACGLH